MALPLPLWEGLGRGTKKERRLLLEYISILLVVLMLVWALPHRILKAIKKSGPRYQCVFEKNIQIPKDLFPEKYRVLFAFGTTLKKRVNLPFPPQQGMSVSEFVDLPITTKNIEEDDIDSVYFDWER